MINELKISFANHRKEKAFCIKNEFYTYADLQKLIKNISFLVSGKGGSSSGKVGIYTTNEIETYASILSCWFCGYAYIPLNPSFPEGRNLNIIRHAGIDMVLTTEDLPSAFYEDKNGIQIICTKGQDDLSFEFEFPKISVRDDTLLYMLFTSGSTGEPKGVPISLGNILSFLDSYYALGFQCSHEDRFLQMFDLSFDVSIASYLVPLLLGSCVYTVPSEGIKYMQVYKILRDYKITFASIVPSIITYLKPYFEEIQLPFLRYCILTAEASKLDTVECWSNCLPNCQIYNLYGPTEATIWCTGYYFNKGIPKSYNEMLIIGKPFKNVEFKILDENGEAAGIGKKGEFCISSSQLTNGYLHNEQRNKDVFFIIENKRFYRTGDLCFVDEENDIFYCGRIDHQVKIQGFRIELSEIEVIAKEMASVNNVAIAYKNKLGVEEIALFLEKYSDSAENLRRSLETKLPYYMIPSKIMVINELPVNTSGKIDRNKLKLQIETNIL